VPTKAGSAQGRLLSNCVVGFPISHVYDLLSQRSEKSVKVLGKYDKKEFLIVHTNDDSGESTSNNAES